jgi:hypothetical protein
MHAYLITGATPQTRLDEIQKRLDVIKISVFDTVSLALEPEEEHIGIEAVRVFQKRLLLAPQSSPKTAGIVKDAHTLTIEAQNALLKLLEEPPPHAIIFCETQNRDSLLPTIISRCEGVLLAEVSPDESIGDMQIFIRDLLSSSPGKKLTLIETLTKDRSAAKTWTQNALLATRNMMLQAAKEGNSETQKMAKLVRLLTTAQGELMVNVNPKLVLDTVFLSL